jgi:mercuric ion transport protein
LISYLSLCTSLATLLCCALPSPLVHFGLGSTVASFLTAAPWLVVLSRHKPWVGVPHRRLLIAISFFYVYRIAPRLKANGDACSVGDGMTACDTATRLSQIALRGSAAIYAIGFFTA